MVAVNFESWLIGFIEGEGSFTHDGNYPRFFLVQKDGGDVFNKLKDFFEAGRIRCNESRIWTFYASGSGCWPIRYLCEDKLQLLKKQKQFEAWKTLEWYFPLVNNKYPNPVIFEDWLIGFIEAEGSFTSMGNNTYPEFSISQDEKEILDRIQEFFGCGKVAKTGNKVAWQLRITGRDDCQKVRMFCEGKLQLEKRRIQFEDWKKLKWENALEVRVKEERWKRFAAAHPDGTFFYGVDASGNKTILNV